MASLGLPPGIDVWSIAITPNPSGAPPNFINPENREKMTSVVGTILVGFAATTTVLRVVSATRNQGRLAVDDWLCIAALILISSYLGLAISMAPFQRHCYDVPLGYILDPAFLKKSYAFNMVAGPASSMPKLAILALYLKLFKPKKWLRWSAWFLVVVVFVMYWSMIPANVVSCGPRNGVWAPWPDYARFPKMLSLGTGIVAVIIDIVLVAMPIPILAQLNLSPKKKTGLILCFLSGIMAVITSAVSLRYRVSIYMGIDNCWDSAPLQTTVIAEGCITIMVSCMPKIYSLFTSPSAPSQSKVYSAIKAIYHKSTSSLGSSLRRSKSSSASSKETSRAPSEENFRISYGRMYQASCQGGRDASPASLHIPDKIYKSVTVTQMAETRRDDYRPFRGYHVPTYSSQL